MDAAWREERPMQNNSRKPDIMCPTCGQLHRRRGRLPAGRQATAFAAVVVAIVVLAVLAGGLTDYWRNFALNIAADLGGAAFFLCIDPMAERRRAIETHIPNPHTEPQQDAERVARPDS